MGISILLSPHESVCIQVEVPTGIETHTQRERDIQEWFYVYVFTLDLSQFRL